MIFRTNAQYWVDKAKGEPQEPSPPQGEQFLELVEWLEMGLNRLEIEAIKAKGITTLLDQLQKTIRDAAPPDLAETAERRRAPSGRRPWPRKRRRQRTSCSTRSTRIRRRSSITSRSRARSTSAA